MLEKIALLSSACLSIISILVVLLKPICGEIRGSKARKEVAQKQEQRQDETDRCLLRSSLLELYYRHAEEKKLKQYEFENAGYLYRQYKVLGGNSFVDKLWAEMQEWQIES